MLIMQAAILIFVLIAGTAVVLTREPASQVVSLSFYGLLLSLMFFLYQAPDVALSQLTVGTVALPLMFMLALARIRRDRERAEASDRGQQEPNSKRAPGEQEETAA